MGAQAMTRPGPESWGARPESAATMFVSRIQSRRMATELIADALAARRDELVARRGRRVSRRASRPTAQADPARARRTCARTREAHHDLLCDVLRRDRPADGARARLRRAPRGPPRAPRDRARGLPGGVPQLPQHRLGRGARRRAREPRGGRRGARGGAHGDRLRRPRRRPQASAAYLEAQQLLLADSDRVRATCSRTCSTAGAPQTAAGLAAARARASSQTRACVLVAARADERAGRRDGALPRAANALAAAIRGRYAPLAVTRHGEIVLVRASAPGERVALRAPLERPASGCAVAARLVLAVGREHRPATGRRRSARAYREASQAVAPRRRVRRRALAARPQRRSSTSPCATTRSRGG